MNRPVLGSWHELADNIREREDSMRCLLRGFGLALIVCALSTICVPVLTIAEQAGHPSLSFWRVGDIGVRSRDRERFMND